MNIHHCLNLFIYTLIINKTNFTYGKPSFFVFIPNYLFSFPCSCEKNCGVEFRHLISRVQANNKYLSKYLFHEYICSFVYNLWTTELLNSVPQFLVPIATNKTIITFYK